MHNSLVAGGLVIGSLVCGSALAGNHCHKCPKCCCCCNGAQGAAAAASASTSRSENRAAVFSQAPLVQSMPVYQTPLMFASMPVMPAMAFSPASNQAGASAAPAAAPQQIRDCCDRVDQLELEVKRLAVSVNQIQTLIEGQNKILNVLVEKLPPAK